MDTNPMPTHEEGPAPGLVEASTSIQQHAQRQGLLGTLRIALISLGLIILSCELGFRVMGKRGETYAEWNSPALVQLSEGDLFEARDEAQGRYGLRPGATPTAGGIEYAISNQGTRGEDFPHAKPANQKRILLLGDGLAMGLGCELEDTLLARLTAAANAAEKAQGSRVHWIGINMGVPGHQIEQHKQQLMTRGLGFEPDLVILQFNLTDLEPETYFLDSSGGLQRDWLPLSVGLRRRLWSSHVYSLIASLQRGDLERTENQVWSATQVRVAWSQAKPQAAALKNLRLMAEVCSEQGTPFFVIDQRLAFDAEAEEQASLLELADWCQGARSELSIKGLSLGPAFLDPGSSLPALGGLMLDAEAQIQGAAEAYAELQGLGFLP